MRGDWLMRARPGGYAFLSHRWTAATVSPHVRAESADFFLQNYSPYIGTIFKTLYSEHPFIV